MFASLIGPVRVKPMPPTTVSMSLTGLVLLFGMYRAPLWGFLCQGICQGRASFLRRELEGEADQDRRESGEPRTLCRLPNGGDRHPTANVPRDFADHRGTTAAASACASMRARCHAFKSDRQEECVQMPGKMARSAASAAVRGARGDGSHPRRQPVLPECGKNAKILPTSAFIRECRFRNE